MLIHCDSADAYGNTGMTLVYDSVSDAPIAAGAGRFGGGAIRVNGHIAKALATPVNELIIQGAFKSMTWGGSGWFLRWLTSYGAQVAARLGTDGSIIFVHGSSGATLAVTPGGVVPISQWRWLSIHIFTHDTTGFIKARDAKGTLLLDATGLDTRGRGETDLISSWEFRADNGGAAHFIDDLMIMDTTGPAPFNSWTKDVGMFYAAPTADGAQNDMTQVGGGSGKYTAVNALEPDGDTSYLYSETVSHRELFAHEDLPSTRGNNVLAVVGVVGWKASDGGGREGTISVRNGGTTADAGENRALEAGQYKIDRIAMPLNPVTAAAWDRTVFNGSELGPKVAV